MIDKTKKITVCLAGGKDFFYYNGYVLEEDDKYIGFEDERVQGKIINLSKKWIIWWKEVTFVDGLGR